MSFDRKSYMKQYLKKYALDRKEHLFKYNKEWRRKNKSTLDKQKRLWYLKNRKRILAREKKKTSEERLQNRIKFYTRHPLKSKQYECVKLSGMPVEYSVIQSVYESNIKKYGTLTCYLCLKPIDFGEDNLEHKTPSRRGGDNSEKNLGVAHGTCNTKKRDRTESEYRSKQRIEEPIARAY